MFIEFLNYQKLVWPRRIFFLYLDINKKTVMDIKALKEIEQLLAEKGYALNIELIMGGIEKQEEIEWGNVKYVKRVDAGNLSKNIVGRIERLPEPYTPGLQYKPFFFSSEYFEKVYAPATKEEVEEHIKKHAVDLYGEFEVGDKLDRSNLDVNLVDTVDTIKKSDIERGLWYDSIYDKLYLGQLILYKNGEWAKLINVWEGVKYAKCVVDCFLHFTRGKIYRLVEEGNIEKWRALYDDRGSTDGYSGSNRECFTPATEYEIQSHLMEESAKRFGQITSEDAFITADGIVKQLSYVSNPWLYDKKLDQFWFHTLLLYKEGKWAERVPQEVKVIYAGTKINKQDKTSVVDFSFRISNLDLNKVSLHKIGDYIQSKLEEHLNEK